MFLVFHSKTFANHGKSSPKYPKRVQIDQSQKNHMDDVMISDDVIVLFLENIVFGIFERFRGVEELF